MILNDTTFVLYCSCHASYSDKYDALKIGNDYTSRVIDWTCSSCGGYNGVMLPTNRATTSQLCAHTLFRKAKDAGATIHASYSAADIEALMTGSYGIADFETLPWDNSQHGGKLYWETASNEYNSTQLLDLAAQGLRFYGTDDAIKGYIDRLTTDSGNRSLLYKLNGLTV